MNKNTIAAIDLGSNSFHMVVAEESDGQLVILDRIREMVRLAEGLTETGELDSVVEQRAIDCLSRFGQRIRMLDTHCVSTVGTNSLRRANNSGDFIFQAEQALGFPIEIISGIEEARLVYQGVAHTLEQDERSRLVIDIGGGSTELIIGHGFQPRLMESLEMGCVMMTERFFADGKIKSKRIDAARVLVLQRMKAVHFSYTNMGWDTVLGSSGSIKSIANVIQQMKLDDSDGISQEALKRLLDICVDYKKIHKLDLPGLSEKRRPVFLGGLIVLYGVFESLGIKRMAYSPGALREGLLYDMVGRRRNNDIRNKSIVSLAERFHVDMEHVKRIKKTANDFYQQLSTHWFIDKAHASNLLHWACMSHEIGRDISHSSFQKHGAYILENADLAGFSRQEQKRLAVIVNHHRGKLIDSAFNAFPAELQNMLIQISIVLRLSVIFHRSRIERQLPQIEISAQKKELVIKLQDQWLNEHPLTINDLDMEAQYLQELGYSLITERTL